MLNRILIVDDSATTRAMIKRVIKMSELPVEQVLEAGDGATALEMLASSAVNLVLLDLNMPTMDGVEVTRRMRSEQATRHIPIVIISAEPNADQLTQLKLSGIQGVIRKPFTPEMIRDIVTRVMGAIHA